MAVRKEFLGRGWAFPFAFDPATGGVALSEYEENIRQSITVILGTKPGERQMNPKFGCRIHELLFAPSTQATGGLVSFHVETALRMWEPRVEVQAVHAHPGDRGELKVTVDYVIISTNTQQNLVYVLSNEGNR